MGNFGEIVRGLDDQRIALEVAARVAVAKADVARRMVPAQIDDALESLALPGVDADRDRVRPLHDAAESGEVRLRSQTCSGRPCSDPRGRRGGSCAACCRTGALRRGAAMAARTASRCRPSSCSCRCRCSEAGPGGTHGRDGSAPERCGVSAGIRPFGGSTTSDVRRPVGFAEVNTAL